MDKFLEKIENDIKNKIIASAQGESIVKPFNQVFKEVRSLSKKEKSQKYSCRNEQSIYDEVIREFLKNNPEFIKEE